MYILDAISISPQNTYEGNFSSLPIEIFEGNQYWAKEPKYKGMVPLNLLRRMSKSVRMGVGTGIPLIQKNEKMDGIIIGSANGSIEKSISFLNQIVEYKEGTLTPTDFVQSTSNSIAGTLALLGNVRAYNNTHVNNGISFESALLDALLLFKDSDSEKILVGGVEEISQANYNVDSLRGMFKIDPVPSNALYVSNSDGTVSGEGASMFVLGKKPQKNTVLEFVDVEQICYPEYADIDHLLQNLLKRNNIDYSDIDTLFLGYNGDKRTDHYYDAFKKDFSHASQLVYKHLVGDYYTVSSFAMWLANEYASKKSLDDSCYLQKTEKNNGYICIYNHYEGTQHGIILLKRH